MEPKVFLMERVTVLNVLELNVHLALRVWHSLKPITQTFVDTLALKTVVGKKEYTPEFTETIKSFKL